VSISDETLTKLTFPPLNRLYVCFVCGCYSNLNYSLFLDTVMHVVRFEADQYIGVATACRMF
jgi:hypothetical protein